MSAYSSALVVLLDALATYRLTRLLTADAIALRLRLAVYRWAWRKQNADEYDLQGDLDVLADDEMGSNPLHTPTAVFLVRCRWCTSVWLGAGVVAARCWAPTLWAPVAVLLAFSAVAVWAARLEA